MMIYLQKHRISNGMKKLIILAFFIGMPLTSLAASPSTLYYGGWVPFWEQFNGVWDVTNNLNKVDEISPFSFEVRPDGTLVDKMKITEGFWPGWINAVQRAPVKVIPSVAWFNGPGIHKLLSNRTTRIAHEDYITKIVVDNKFDGIDIDYEAKLAETKPYFSTFLYGMAIRLHPKKKILSCTIEPRTPLSSLYDTIPEEEPERANDYVEINKYCDIVRIMAYDQGVIDQRLNEQKGNGALYAPVADTAWVEKVIQETLKTIGRRKIEVGIPTYGYEYQVRWDGGVTHYERLRSHTYVQAMERAKTMGATPARNNAGELGFTYATSTWVGGVSEALTWDVPSGLPIAIAQNNANGKITRFVTFSDAGSAADKIALVRKYGLRGAFFFKFDGQQDPTLWSVMK